MTRFCTHAARAAGDDGGTLVAPAVHQGWVTGAAHKAASRGGSSTRAMPRPTSIRARYTVAAVVSALIVVAIIGASLSLVIRYRVEADVLRDTERIASQWSAAARIGAVPSTIPTTGRVDLVQLVDAHGKVLNSSRAAAGRRPLHRERPPVDDRFQTLTACGPRGRCVMTMAIRVTPTDDSPVVYAGTAQPRILSSHTLEFVIAVVSLPIVALAGWLTWCMVGRTLRPVEAIRTRMSEITGSDLSARVPLPEGRDEIALLAHTANQTLARLEGAVKQQRQFASNTSHELRTPLAGLRAQLEEAVLYPADVDPHDAIRAALSTTDRLEAIVGDLLALARMRAADPAHAEPIDLGALVAEETASRVKGMPVHVEVARGVQVRGSRIQLIRVLDNVLDNARRHANALVEVTVTPKGGHAVVSVTDDGTGIAPKDRERVFERFTRLADGRTKDPAGSGLGLAISRDIAHTHHGTLTVEDSPHGARFVLRIPLMDAEPMVTGRQAVSA